MTNDNAKILNDAVLEYKNTTDKLNEVIKSDKDTDLLNAGMLITQGMKIILDKLNTHDVNERWSVRNNENI